jgi:hypothetical protein
LPKVASTIRLPATRSSSSTVSFDGFDVKRQALLRQNQISRFLMVGLNPKRRPRSYLTRDALSERPEQPVIVENRPKALAPQWREKPMPGDAATFPFGGSRFNALRGHQILTNKHFFGYSHEDK